MDLSVNYFVPEHPAVPLTLRNLLRERQSERLFQLVNARDWADYMYKIGYLQALADDIQECENIEKNLNR